MKVLVTGGARLHRFGHGGRRSRTPVTYPVVLDSLLTGPREFTSGRIFYEGDIADRRLLQRVVAEHPEIGCHDPHGRADRRTGVGRAALCLLPRQRREVARALRRAGPGWSGPRVVFSLVGVALRHRPEGFEVTEESPLGSAVAVRPHQADDGAGAHRQYAAGPGSCRRSCCATSTRSAPTPT